MKMKNSQIFSYFYLALLLLSSDASEFIEGKKYIYNFEENLSVSLKPVDITRIDNKFLNSYCFLTGISKLYV